MTGTEPKTLPNARDVAIVELALQAAAEADAEQAASATEYRTRRRTEEASLFLGALRRQLGLELDEGELRWETNPDTEYGYEQREERPCAWLDGLHFSYARTSYTSGLVVHPPCDAHPDRPAASHYGHLNNQTPWADLGRAVQDFNSPAKARECEACAKASYERQEAEQEAAAQARGEREQATTQDAVSRLKSALFDLVGEALADHQGE